MPTIRFITLSCTEKSFKLRGHYGWIQCLVYCLQQYFWPTRFYAKNVFALALKYMPFGRSVCKCSYRSAIWKETHFCSVPIAFMPYWIIRSYLIIASHRSIRLLKSYMNGIKTVWVALKFPVSILQNETLRVFLPCFPTCFGTA